MKAKINELFDRTGVDAIILRTFPENPEPAFYYFSGIPFGAFENNLLLLRRNKKPLLVRSVLDPEVTSAGLHVRTVKKRQHVEKLLGNELAGKKIGLNKESYPIASFNRLRRTLSGKRLVDVSGHLRDIRAVKKPWELERISKAVKITEKVLSQVPGIFKKGMTEKQLALELEFMLREKSGEGLAFPLIVASGRNSAFPHHMPVARKIGRGILLIDAGARFRGYCADLTRTFCVGKPSAQEKKFYNAVFEAKFLGEELSLEGVKAVEVFAKASLFLKKHTGKSLVHGLGHGLGIAVHDSPKGFLAESKDVLERNMVLTVEPAVYTKRFGIRIEDDIVVQKGRCRKLSNAPKALIAL